jgi:hypothetical protein
MNRYFIKLKDNLYIDLQKARPTKYIKRWKGADGKWKYLYLDDFKKPFSALLNFFKFNKEQVSKSYESLNIKDKYDIDEKEYSRHLLEYLTNRNKWNEYFNKEKKQPSEKSEKKEKKEKSGNKVVNNKTKISFNKSIMKDIHNFFSGSRKIVKIEPVTEKEIKEDENKINKKIEKEVNSNIPEEFENKTPIKEKLEIVKRGRKYFKVRVPGRTFLMDLYITESNNNLQEGDIVEINVLKNEEYSKYGTKVQYYPLSDNKKEEIEAEKEKEYNKKEIKRWMEYVRSAANSGYIYQKGMNRLYELGADKIAEIQKELGEIHIKVQNKKTIQKINDYLGYMKEAANKGYVYRNGLSTLRKLKIEKYPEKEKELNDILDSVEKTRKEKGMNDYKVFPNNNQPPIGIPIKLGNDIIVYEKSGKSFYIDENMPSMNFSLLGHEGETAARFYYRKATEDEIKKYNENKEFEEKRQQAKNELYSLQNKMATIDNKKQSLIFDYINDMLMSRLKKDVNLDQIPEDKFLEVLKSDIEKIGKSEEEKEIEEEREKEFFRNRILRYLQEKNIQIKGINIGSDINKNNINDIEKAISGISSSFSTKNDIRSLESIFMSERNDKEREKMGTQYMNMNNVSSADFFKFRDEMDIDTIKKLKTRFEKDKENKKRKEERMKELIGSGKWNGKIYGKRGNYSIYISGDKKDISDEDADILK